MIDDQASCDPRPMPEEFDPEIWTDLDVRRSHFRTGSYDIWLGFRIPEGVVHDRGFDRQLREFVWYNAELVRLGRETEAKGLAPHCATCSPTPDAETERLHWVDWPIGVTKEERAADVWTWLPANRRWQTAAGNVVSEILAGNCGHRYLGPAVCPYELEAA